MGCFRKTHKIFHSTTLALLSWPLWKVIVKLVLQALETLKYRKPQQFSFYDIYIAL